MSANGKMLGHFQTSSCWDIQDEIKIVDEEVIESRNGEVIPDSKSAFTNSSISDHLLKLLSAGQAALNASHLHDVQEHLYNLLWPLD